MIQKQIFTFFLFILPLLLNANSNKPLEPEYEDYLSQIILNTDGVLKNIKNAKKSNLINQKNLNNFEDDLLFSSIKFKRNPIFKELLKKGLDTNSIINDSSYLSHILKYNIDLLEYLLKERDNYILYINKSGNTILNNQTNTLDYNILKQLLDEINPKENLSTFEYLNNKKMSFLHYLIKHNNIEALKYLNTKFNYKITNISEKLLKYSYDNNIKTFPYIISLLDDTHFNNFFIKNKKNIISYIFKNKSNDFINSTKQKIAIDSIFKHLKKNNKLEFLFSKNEDGFTFFHNNIKNKNITLIEKFNSEKLKINLPNSIYSFALKNNSKYLKPLKNIINNFNIGEVFNELLKEESSSKKLLLILPDIDISTINNPNNKKNTHFLLTALKYDRIDFITEILKLKKDLIFPNSFIYSLTKKKPLFSISLFNKNLLTPKNHQRKKLLYINITNKSMNAKTKINYIYGFINNNIFSTNDLKETFFSKNKDYITIYGLISHLFPSNEILSHIKVLKTSVQEKPFKSIYDNKPINSFYINDFFKTNKFGISLIEYSVLRDYKYITDIYNLMNLDDFLKKGKNQLNIIEFSKKYNSTKLNTLNKFLLNKFNYSISYTNNNNNNNNYIKTDIDFSTLEDNLLSSILNNSKIDISDKNIDFDNFILPSYLYNKGLFNKISNKSLINFKTKLIKELVIHNDIDFLEKFLLNNRINLTNNKTLGKLSVTHQSKKVLHLLLNNYFINSNFYYLNGSTPLHTQLFSSHYEKVKKYIKYNKADLFFPLMYHTELETINHIRESLDIDLYSEIKKSIGNSKIIKDLFISEYNLIIENDSIDKLNLFLKNLLIIEDYPLISKIISFHENRNDMFKSALNYRHLNKTLQKKDIYKIIFEIFSNNRNKYLNNLNINEINIIINNKKFFSSVFFKLENLKQKVSFINYFFENNIKLKFFNLENLIKNKYYTISTEILNNDMIIFDNKSIQYFKILDILYNSKNNNNIDKILFFKFFINKYIDKNSINLLMLKKSILKIEEFKYLLNKSNINVQDYSKLFDFILLKDPNALTINRLLKHKTAKNISLNRIVGQYTILEHYLINSLDDLFSSTLKNIHQDINKEDCITILKTISSINNIELFKKHIIIFKQLIKKHNIDSFDIFLNNNSVDFIKEDFINQLHNSQKSYEENIFKLFKNNEIKNSDKIKLFYTYKKNKFNILLVDTDKKTIFHYLTDFKIKEKELNDLLNKVEVKIMDGFIAKYNLFNYILNNKYTYDNIILQYITNDNIIDFKHTTDTEEFSLLVIKHKKYKIFKKLLKTNFNFKAINEQSKLRAFDYAILTNDIRFIEPFIKNGYFVTNSDIDFATLSKSSPEIIEQLTGKTNILFRIKMIYYIIKENLYIFFAALLLIFGFIIFIKFKKKKIKEPIIKKEPTKKELELELLLKKANDNSEVINVDENILLEVKDDFESLEELKKAKDIERNLLSATFSKENDNETNPKTFIIEDLKEELSSIKNEDCKINEDLLAQMENDFDNQIHSNNEDTTLDKQTDTDSKNKE